jgi:hypothetical protein
VYSHFNCIHLRYIMQAGLQPEFEAMLVQLRSELQDSLDVSKTIETSSAADSPGPQLLATVKPTLLAQVSRL